MAEDISFLQEVDESLRVERLEQFWRQHGKLVIAGCVAVVLCTLGSVLWKNHVRGEREKQTDLLIRADTLALAGKTSDAAAIFKEAENGTAGLATLARLRRAEILSDAGKNDQALVIYKEIAADGNSDEALRDLARMRADIMEGNTAKGHPDYANNHTFSGFTDELEALQLVKAGKPKEARAVLNTVIQNNALPQSQRLRALEILDTIPEGTR